MLCYVTKGSKIFADHKKCLFLTSITCPEKVDGHLWSSSSHSEPQADAHSVRSLAAEQGEGLATYGKPHSGS